MPLPARSTRMTTDEFLAWAMAQPEGERYELVAGEVVAMAPERSAHALVKARVWRALHDALAQAGLRCTAYPDGMAVEIEEGTVYEPDALVRCGEPLPDDAVKVPDPVIVVEVVSPSSGGRDTGVKLAGYFRLASVRHYLIVRTEGRGVIHHRRDAEGTIQTRILTGGLLELDPPGVAVGVDSFFD